MLTQPKDPTRKRRYHHPRQQELEDAYGLRFPACFFALYEFACVVDPAVNSPNPYSMFNFNLCYSGSNELYDKDWAGVNGCVRRVPQNVSKQRILPRPRTQNLSEPCPSTLLGPARDASAPRQLERQKPLGVLAGHPRRTPSVYRDE